MRKSKHKKAKQSIIVIFILACIYLLITTGSICIYAGHDEAQKSDVAIILGASITSKGVSPVFRERLNHGIWLYENGYVDAIIVSGGVGEGNIRSEASVAKDYLVSQQIPMEKIYLEERSTITQENIEYSKILMDENQFQTAIIVSDPLHMKRAMLMTRDYGIEGFSSPTPTTMYRSLKTQIPFLAREEFFYVGYRIYRRIPWIK